MITKFTFAFYDIFFKGDYVKVSKTDSQIVDKAFDAKNSAPCRENDKLFGKSLAEVNPLKIEDVVSLDEAFRFLREDHELIRLPFSNRYDIYINRLGYFCTLKHEHRKEMSRHCKIIDVETQYVATDAPVTPEQALKALLSIDLEYLDEMDRQLAHEKNDLQPDIQ